MFRMKVGLNSNQLIVSRKLGDRGRFWTENWPSAVMSVLIAGIHLAAVWWLIQVSSPQLKPLESSAISGVIIPPPKAVPKVASEPPSPPEEVLINKTESPVEIEAPKPSPAPKPEPIPEPEVAAPEPDIIPESELIQEAELAPVPEEVPEITEEIVTVDPITDAPAPIAEPRADAAHFNNPLPTYPRQSLRRKEEGTVLVEVLVLADGSVGEVRLKLSSGYSRLDKSALAAVKNWRYVPAIQGDNAIDYWYEQPVVFALK